MPTILSADDPLAVVLDEMNRPEVMAIHYVASRRGDGPLWTWMQTLTLESCQLEPTYPAPPPMPTEYRRAAARVVLPWCRLENRRLRDFYRGVLDHLLAAEIVTSEGT